MSSRVLIDTDPLVTAFDQRDAYANRTTAVLKTVHSPMLTCEPVLTETWFLLKHLPDAWAKIEKWMDLGFLKVAFTLELNRTDVFHLMAKYRDLPMSLADARPGCHPIATGRIGSLVTNRAMLHPPREYPNRQPRRVASTAASHPLFVNPNWPWTSGRAGNREPPFERFQELP